MDEGQKAAQRVDGTILRERRPVRRKMSWSIIISIELGESRKRNAVLHTWWFRSIQTGNHYFACLRRRCAPTQIKK
jgi:hypothetical protein